MTLTEYLRTHKEKSDLWKLLIKITISLSVIVGVWIWPWLDSHVLSKVPHRVLWSVLVVLSIVSTYLYSYIRYVGKESNLEKLLMKYEHDKEFGTLVNKTNKEHYCLNCLYSSKREIPLQKYGDSYKCRMKDCSEIYSKHVPPGGVTSEPQPMRSSFWQGNQSKGFANFFDPDAW